MLERTFHTPLPLELEVGIPSGDIEVETTEGEESNITVDGDDRLLEEVEIRQDGNRLVVAYRGKGKLGFSLSPFSLVFGSELRVRATVPHSAGLKVKTASADTHLDGRFGALGVNSVSGDVRLRGEVAGGANLKTVSGDADLDRVERRPVRAHRLGRPPHRADRRLLGREDGLGRHPPPGRPAPATSASRASPATSRSASPQGSAVDVDAGSASGDLSSEVPLASEPGRPGRSGPDRRRSAARRSAAT